MNDFYFFITDNKRGTPYAPTIVSSNPIYLDNCPKCDATRFNENNRDLSLIIEGKRALPDYLNCGHYSLCIVSDKVIEAWQKNNVTGYTVFPIKKLFTDKKGNELSTNVQYFNVTITGRAELDYKQMNIKIKKQCSKCGYIEYNKDTWEFGTAVIKTGTYDGSDLFVVKGFEAMPICTIKMLEIVYKEKLTNFAFRSYKSLFSYLHLPPAVDLKTIFK